MTQLSEILSQLSDSLDEREFDSVMKFLGTVSDAAQELRGQSSPRVKIILFTLAGEMFQSDLERIVSELKLGDHPQQSAEAVQLRLNVAAAFKDSQTAVINLMEGWDDEIEDKKYSH